MESWLKRETSLEKILPLLEDSVDMLKIKILMKEIDKIRKKVEKVLRALRNSAFYQRIYTLSILDVGWEIDWNTNWNIVYICNHKLNVRQSGKDPST